MIIIFESMIHYYKIDLFSFKTFVNSSIFMSLIFFLYFFELNNYQKTGLSSSKTGRAGY